MACQFASLYACFIINVVWIRCTSGAISISAVGGTRNEYFLSNRQIQFNCVYDSSYNFISFQHNGTQIPPSGRYFIYNSITHHSLVVGETQPTDGGTYSCTVERSGSQEQISVSTFVMYEERIVINSPNVNFIGTYQGPYTLPCKAENIRTRRWIQNGTIQLTNSTDGRIQVLNDGSLHYTSLRLGDTGSYYCAVSSFYEYDHGVYYNFAVYEDVSFKIAGDATNGYFTVNKQIQLDCVYGSSIEFISLTHNDTEISSSGRVYVVTSNTQHSVVVSKTQPSDGGTWTCTLRKLADGKQYVMTARTVYEEPIIFQEAQYDLTGPYLEAYTLPCVASNIRTRKWIHSNTRITDSADGRVQELNDGGLHFATLRMEDAGIYYCVVSSNYEEEHIVVTLTVTAFPKVDVVKQPSYWIEANDIVTLTCTASSAGIQSVGWSRESDGSRVFSQFYIDVDEVFRNDTTIVSMLRFAAITASQQDTYRCNATSTVGSSSRSTEVYLSSTGPSGDDTSESGSRLQHVRSHTLSYCTVFFVMYMYVLFN